MTSLTREAARDRARLLTVDSYRIDLDLTTGDTTFASTTTVRFRAARGAATFLDVKPQALRRARLNGTDLDVDDLFSAADGRLTLPSLDDDNELVVEAVMAYSHDGEGLHRHVDPADGAVYLYAMSFLDAAPRWFACFDQPDLKAPVSMSVICPPSWTVIGSAAAVQEAPGHWQLATTEPLATYFTTLVAGPYHSITGEHDGIPLGLHCRGSLAPYLDRDAEELLGYTAACFDEFHRLFGIRYPWGRYHQAFVPEFNALAMENPGCVTLRDPFVYRSRVTDAERARRASTIAHEMAHMWFGDLVTMRWWDDLWLNESFAEYLGHRVCDAVSEHRSWIEFGIQRKAWGYLADRRPSTHPVAGNGAVDAARALSDFDGISYAKGASLLRQLATHLGDDVFLDGLRRHFDAHRFGNAEFADLIGAWTAAGAPDVPGWAEQWLRTSGLDTLRAVSRNGGVEVHRLAPTGTPANRPHAVAVASFAADGRETARTRARLTAPVTTAPAHEPNAALVLPDAADETWAKIALDPATWQAMPALLPDLDPTVRVVVWNALRLAVADAEVDPRLAVDIIVAALPREPEQTVVANVAGWLVGPLTGAYLSPETGSGALERVAQALRPVLSGAAPESAHQLALAHTYVGCCADVDELRTWLAGDPPRGLTVDADLRWLIVQRLAALGALSAQAVDDELAADNSSQGRVQAAKAHALRPDPAAKAQAWTALVSDAGRANYELYAIAEGFWHPRHAEVTAPYVERYFVEFPGTAALRSGWVVGRVARFAFPWTAVEPATLARTEQLLARPDLDPKLRREIVDAGDDLRRALAARTTFG